ncbi:MAG: orotidine-5'-phosphate decarboxylase [Candidatus Paceibacterota bacterium]
MEKFRETLAKRQENVNSLVCVGLDPLEEKIPRCISGINNEARMTTWLINIVDATAPYASMFKPQWAHYESLSYGRRVLRRVVRHIQDNYLDIVDVLDCKDGDIDRTQLRYAISHFKYDAVRGMNFNPYMGSETMQALAAFDREDIRAIVGLCVTSNRSARTTQNIKLSTGQMYYEFIAECILKWSTEFQCSSAGLVMAAAYDEPKGSGIISYQHLINIRNIVGDKLWFLIPGIGTQGGFIDDTVKYGWAGYGSMVINSSSEIDFASNGTDYAEAAGLKAKELRDKIRQSMNKYGFGKEK